MKVIIRFWRKTKAGWLESDKQGKTSLVKEKILVKDFQEYQHIFTSLKEEKRLEFISRSGYDRGPGILRKLSAFHG